MTKLLLALLLIFYSLLLLFGGILLCAVTEGLDVSISWLVTKMLIIYVTSLPMMGILFYLSYRFQHIAIPLAVGGGLALPSMLVANSEKYWIYYPWDYPIIGSLNHLFSLGGKETVLYAVCIGIFLFFLLTGFLRFKAKDIV